MIPRHPDSSNFEGDEPLRLRKCCFEAEKKVERTRTNRIILLFVHREKIGTIANAVENALELEWGTNCDSNAR